MTLTLSEKMGIRRVLVRAQGSVCAVCGRGIEPDYHRLPKTDHPSLDHVIPTSRGGADGLGNVLATHIGCNHRKGDDMPTGCELIWLLAINCKLGLKPDRW